MISSTTEPRGALTGHTSTHTVLADTGPFHGLLLTILSRFWGPGAIFTIDDPQGALTYRSQTLAVLADSGPFRGLLITVLGSQSDYHD